MSFSCYNCIAHSGVILRWRKKGSRVHTTPAIGWTSRIAPVPFNRTPPTAPAVPPDLRVRAPVPVTPTSLSTMMMPTVPSAAATIPCATSSSWVQDASTERSYTRSADTTCASSSSNRPTTTLRVRRRAIGNRPRGIRRCAGEYACEVLLAGESNVPPIGSLGSDISSTDRFELMERGLKSGVERLRIVGREELFEMELALNPKGGSRRRATTNDPKSGESCQRWLTPCFISCVHHDPSAHLW